MIRLALAALALLAAPAAAEVYTPPPPATVVVAFDRETIRPLIVEGLADKATGRKLEANDPVRIASISKLIMALAALRLADEGKVDLDRDVSDYLGWRVRSPYFPDVPVTLAQLMSHRAGLSGSADYIIPLGESLEAKFADPASWRKGVRPATREALMELEPDPDTFLYSNLGAPLVATVLEAASGERYDRLVERLVFAPLGVKACFNWVGCGPDMEARAVVLYRDTGEVAKDGAGDLPPNCTIPVIAGQACNLDNYVPGTNASIFSPQGGVRIGMVDLARIGQELFSYPQGSRLSFNSFLRFRNSAIWGPTGASQFFCRYGLALQMIGIGSDDCEDDLFGSGGAWVGHPGEAYGLVSGLWFSQSTKRGFVYFTTENAPPPGGEDTGNFTPREKALMARALELAGK
ncbi:serine hydrolase [Erythrobacter sp. CCH5-A1]|jgi:CubicO group peptidase (beta-lactamase class C family)|uniref:serine hydrolase domain-containing protein n=1 Tax=Erythrobacter sp. CCH5-A1 TaxID=1768792 RepID=UPI00082A50FE|nr:serine hydrolase domain-containing protein [Erythrobacter sp. CCH5-A1]